MTHPIPIVLNSSAYQADEESSPRRIQDLFRSRGAEAVIVRADSGRPLPPLLSEDAGPQKVVAAGGDGTVGMVAAAVVGTPHALGVLPLGTFNHFAKDAGLPLNLEDAVDVVLAGREVTVDVGEVNGRVFVNNSSIGLYPTIVHDREKQQARLGRGKWSAFTVATLRALRRAPLLDIQLEVGGKSLARRTPALFVGNNTYTMEGFQIGKRERLDAGELSFYMIHATGGGALLGLAARALLGRLRPASDFDTLHIREASIGAVGRRQLRVATDGEVTLLETPLRYRIRARALRVLAPVSQTERAAPRESPTAQKTS